MTMNVHFGLLFLSSVLCSAQSSAITAVARVIASSSSSIDVIRSNSTTTATSSSASSSVCGDRSAAVLHETREKRVNAAAISWCGKSVRRRGGAPPLSLAATTCNVRKYVVGE